MEVRKAKFKSKGWWKKHPKANCGWQSFGRKEVDFGKRGEWLVSRNKGKRDVEIEMVEAGNFEIP